MQSAILAEKELSMAIPSYEQLMLPLLEIAGDKKEHSLASAVDRLAEQFHLTAEEKNALVPSRTQRIIYNRVGWARTYLQKSQLLEAPKRGHFKITKQGLKVLRSDPPEINYDYLMQFPAFQEFRRHSGKPGQTTKKGTAESSPEETLALAHADLKKALTDELLQTVKESTPFFFETLVIDLLISMGYGGSRGDAGKHMGGTGDEGIDGMIKEDSLGLDVIYVQAKRWQAVVGRPRVQEFSGALQGKGAKKGVLITTSTFSTAARKYVEHIDSKIILIDGETLVELMVEHDVGVSTVVSYDVKKVNTDYFEE